MPGAQSDPAKVFGDRRGQIVAQRHGDASGEHEEDCRHDQVVLAHKHQSRCDPNVHEGQEAGESIAGQKCPAQPRRPRDPAQPVRRIPGSE